MNNKTASCHLDSYFLACKSNPHLLKCVWRWWIWKAKCINKAWIIPWPQKILLSDWTTAKSKHQVDSFHWWNIPYNGLNWQHTHLNNRIMILTQPFYCLKTLWCPQSALSLSKCRTFGSLLLLYNIMMWLLPLITWGFQLHLQ